MRRVGGKLFLLRKRRFQPRESGIQNGRELAQFTFRLGDVDALRQIAGGNFCGRGADVLNGPLARDRPTTSHRPARQ